MKATPISLLGLGLGNFKKEFTSLPSLLRKPAKKFVDKFLPSSSWSANFERNLGAHLGRRVKLFDTEAFSPSVVKKNKDFFSSGATVANFGTPVKGIKGRTFGAPISTLRGSSAWENKLNEANFLKGILPETYGVAQLAKEFGINMRAANAGALLQQAARNKFGNKFLFKPITSHQTNPASFPTQQSSPADLIKTLRSGITGNSGDLFGKGYKNWVVQRKLDIKAPSLLDRAIKFIHPSGTGAREYRVHTIGNKVIPYASTYRGNARMVLPWATKEQLKVERELQNLLSKKLDKRFSNTPFAFDVVIGKNGRPIPIEANPATLSGASGLVSTPHVTDAILSHLGNKIPLYVLRQRALAQSAKNTANSAASGVSAVAPSLYSYNNR
jgi:hypothetical protein